MNYPEIWNTGVLKVSMVLLIVSLYGCTPQTPENDYDYTAEGDPLLAGHCYSLLPAGPRRK